MAITNAWQERENAVFIQALSGFAPAGSRVAVSMLRLDVLHPIVSGNKWFKLKYNLEAALMAGNTSVLTFGGAYSNHLIATAAAARDHGIASIGLVRGLHAATLTPVLQQCSNKGMSLQELSRADYSRKEEPAFLEQLTSLYPGACIIPEGGANAAGRRGAGEIARYITPEYTHVCLSVGSATTIAGLRCALPRAVHITGFAPMKGGVYLTDVINEWTGPEWAGSWSLTDAFHGGGFGKITDPLRVFMETFRQQYGFELDRVYTAKMMLGLQQMLSNAVFPEGAHILCIHTGGLSGN